MDYKVTAIYFSPTHGTERYVKEIAGRLDDGYVSIDLTREENRQKEYYFTDRDLVIFGAPVYSGRIPLLEHGIFNCVHGSHTPAIFNVSYGNREFEDALLEEKNICEKNGFTGIAAAAWIAPHTFSDKIAADRPDKRDIEQVETLVGRIKEIMRNKTKNKEMLQVPGNYPYRECKKMPIFPSGNEACVYCNTCVCVCPVGAIPSSDPKTTDISKCIDCLACVKNCPEGAREIANPMFHNLVLKLEDSLLKVRKEPEFFF